MRPADTRVVASAICALWLMFLPGGGQTATAQETVDEVLYSRLKRAGKLAAIAEAAARSGDRVVAIQLEPDVVWTTTRYSINDVTTTGKDSPLILAEQYSTNCTTSEMQRTFTFSEQKEETSETRYDHEAGVSLGLSRSLEAGVNAGGVSVKQQITLSLEATYSYTWGQSKAKTESTAWEDSVTTTLQSRQIGRARLLVTSNTADVRFTQVVRVSGGFRPIFEGEEPRKACFYQLHGGGGKRGCYSNSGAINTAEFGVSSLEFKGEDTRVEVFSNKTPSGWMMAFDWREEKGDDSPPPTVRDNWWTSSDPKRGAPCLLVNETDADESGRLRGPFVRCDFQGNWDDTAESFRVIDLSRSVACLYQDRNFKKAGYIRCFNAGEEEALVHPFRNFFSSALVQSGLELHVWTDAERAQRTILAAADGKEWTKYKLEELNLENDIEHVKVVPTAGESGVLELRTYLDAHEREFSLDGTYHSVFQTNSRAEAFSEPASWEACGCAGNPETEVCGELHRRPKNIIVQALGNGMIEYEGFLYRHQCSIPSALDGPSEQGKGGVKDLVKAVPAENARFVEWVNGAGEVVSDSYSPSSGETVSAVFKLKTELADETTIEVRVVGGESGEDAGASGEERTVAIQGFWHLVDDQWRYVNWDDPLIRWSEGWVAQEGAEGPFKNSGRPGAFAKLTFSGTAVQALLSKGPHRGKAEIYLDSKLEKELNLKDSQESSFEPLYSSLEETVEIHRLGNTREESSGTVVAIGGFSYFNPEEERWVRVRLEDPSLEWVKNWGSDRLSQDSETYRFSDQEDAHVRFTFSGTAATVSVIKGPNRGMAKADEGMRTLDLYAPDEGVVEEVIYDGLASVVRVEVAGRRYISATDESVAIRGFRHDSPMGETADVPWNDPAINWDGKWEVVNGEYKVSRAAGSSAEFSGRNVEVLLVKGPDRGYAKIYLDEELDRTVDLFSRESGSRTAVEVGHGLHEERGEGEPG